MIKVSKKLLGKTASNRPPEYMEEVAAATTAEDEWFIYMDDTKYDSIRLKYRKESPASRSEEPQGVGTELKKLISWFPVPRKTACRSCNDLELRMNRWGTDMCEKQMDYICQRLKEAAHQRGLPFSRFVSELIVKRAISKAKTKIGSRNSGASN